MDSGGQCLLVSRGLSTSLSEPVGRQVVGSTLCWHKTDVSGGGLTPTRFNGCGGWRTSETRVPPLTSPFQSPPPRVSVCRRTCQTSRSGSVLRFSVSSVLLSSKTRRVKTVISFLRNIRHRFRVSGGLFCPSLHPPPLFPRGSFRFTISLDSGIGNSQSLGRCSPIFFHPLVSLGVPFRGLWFLSVEGCLSCRTGKCDRSSRSGRRKRGHG